MATVFISYSSTDKCFARRLAEDLEQLGHKVWFDEWHLRVGHNIPVEVNRGIEESDFLVLVLTPEATESKWVENEWSSKYWDEIETGTIALLPALKETCQVPAILSPRKYADFRSNYSVGLVSLCQALSPTIQHARPFSLPPTQGKTIDAEITDILYELQRESEPLAASLTRALALARRAKDIELQRFCRLELEGYDSSLPDNEIPEYRIVQVFSSANHQINPYFAGFAGNPGAVFDYMRANPDDFVLQYVQIRFSVSEIEARCLTDPYRQFWSMPATHSDLGIESTTPDAQVFRYARGDAFQNIARGIRSELSTRLLALLP